MTGAPEAATVRTDDGIELRIQYRRHGGGRPLVLVHGYTGALTDWDPVAADLAADRTVITYDHRGHGGSDHGPAGSYTIDRLVSDLGRVLAWAHAEFSTERVDLVGHSMGGVVAMIHAVAHPDELTSLVLMDTAGAPEFQVPGQVAEIAAVGRASGMGVVAQLVVDFLRAQEGMSGPADDVAARMITRLAATDVEAFDALARELNSFPPVNGLGTLDLPTTIVVGETDAGLREPAQRLASMIPGAELVVIAGAGHSPQEDAPEVVIEALLRHLGRTRPA
ncbi:alpha/beta fold hydrolase [Streptomyces sp. NPDC058221]|uniref:alpha/beta fold hydrolase n=1 Tax=Streptomyces sp. NPDC058221 TaxID=3346388 RepID=UPI0036E19123